MHKPPGFHQRGPQSCLIVAAQDCGDKSRPANPPAVPAKPARPLFSCFRVFGSQQKNQDEAHLLLLTRPFAIPLAVTVHVHDRVLGATFVHGNAETTSLVHSLMGAIHLILAEMGFFSRSKSTAPSPQSSAPPPVPADTRPAALPLPSPGSQRQLPPPQYTPPQTSGYVAPPQGLTAGGPPPPAYQLPPQQAPIVVHQHYHLYRSHGMQGSATSNCPLTRLAVDSAVHLTTQVMPGLLPALLEAGPASATGCASRTEGPSNHCMEQLYNRFNDVMTLIDRERFCGDERDLFLCRQSGAESAPATDVTSRGRLRGKPKKSQPKMQSGHPKGQTTGVAASVLSGNYFAKVELYANSRLPMNLPPLKLYIPTWPLLCLAAQYSEKVYEKARGRERDVQVEAGHGGKAVVIKSVPMDHMNTIVFAIRGTSTFMDWAVNLNTEPVSPSGFLDDEGNFCHAGFLSVARSMVKPVAARLRQLLQENPDRLSHSLLITGHSAGGAVAALLYSHMLSAGPAVRSELNALTECFKRLHCVTFGTPPVSLLPLLKPSVPDRPELAKSLFLSFVNEGDPVARADKAYVRSLLDLFASPAPALDKPSAQCPSSPSLAQPRPRGNRSAASLVSVTAAATIGKAAPRIPAAADGPPPAAAAGPVWPPPPCTLSNAGRIVVLRSGDPRARLRGRKTVEERLNEGVVAQVAAEEQLRGVVWGDPVCHVMKLYAGRLEILAVNAVTAKGY